MRPSHFFNPQQNEVQHHGNDENAGNKVLRMSIVVVPAKIWKLLRREEFDKKEYRQGV